MRKLVRLITGDVSSLIVYAADSDKVCPPELQVGLEFLPLTPDDLHGLPGKEPYFQVRQLERLVRFGASYAYGVYVDGKIAHVSWLLPPAAMDKDVPQVLRARADEAEITCCETLPAFRGRGIYGFAIRNLFEVAYRQGIRRIYMKTTYENKASQSGIEKAGLVRQGITILITLPIIQRLVVWPRRF